MKTLMMFNDLVDGEAYFFDLEGDRRGLDDTYLGSGFLDNKYLEVLSIWENPVNHPVLSQPTKDWDYFIRCGVR